jgi:DNA-binding MarR family transcriptional regulator
MGLEARSLTRLLNSMEERGVIERNTDPTDKRSVRVCLTAKGKEMREKAKETVVNFNELIYEEVGMEKLTVFFEVIETIQQIVEKNNNYETILK